MGYFNNSDVIQTDLSLAGSNAWSTEFQVLDVIADAPAGTGGWFVYHAYPYTHENQPYKMYFGFNSYNGSRTDIGVQIFNGNGAATEVVQFNVTKLNTDVILNNIQTGLVSDPNWLTGNTRPSFGSPSITSGACSTIEIVPDISAKFRDDTGLNGVNNVLGNYYGDQGVVVTATDADRLFIAVDGIEAFRFNVITTFPYTIPSTPDPWAFRATSTESGSRRHRRLRLLGFNA